MSIEDAIRENIKLRAEIAELKRLLSEAGIVIGGEGTITITDDFGNVYPKYCEGCGAPNEIVRPGDCRCSRRCYETRDEKP